MRVGKHTKCFFDKEHFKTLNSKLDYSTYRKFIRQIHLRVCSDIILQSNEGFIMPCKMGEILVVKQKKKEGVFTTHSALTRKRKEYNAHTFGYIYNIKWDKKVRAHYYHNTRSNLVPKYNGNPIYWFPVYKFTATRYHLKRALAAKIFNREFEL